MTPLFQSANLFDVFHHEPFDPNDPEDQVRQEAFRGQVDALEVKVEKLTGDLAKRAALYVQTHNFSMAHTPFGSRPALVLTCNVGDLAWSPRIQDPEQDQFDRMAREIESASEIDGFLDARSQLEADLRRAKGGE